MYYTGVLLIFILGTLFFCTRRVLNIYSERGITRRVKYYDLSKVSDNLLDYYTNENIRLKVESRK